MMFSLFLWRVVSVCLLLVVLCILYWNICSSCLVIIWFIVLFFIISMCRCSGGSVVVGCLCFVLVSSVVGWVEVIGVVSSVCRVVLLKWEGSWCWCGCCVIVFFCSYSICSVLLLLCLFSVSCSVVLLLWCVCVLISS